MLMLYLPGLLLAYAVADALGVFDEESAVSEDVPPPTDVSPLGGEDDVFIGTDNIDIVRGGDGNDDISGAGADDELLGEAGDDTLYGGDGDDTLTDTTGADLLYGDAGDDLLIGDTLDTMFGGDGTDIFEVSELDVTDAAARISDIEPGETLRIAVPEAGPDESLTTQIAANGADLEISFRGDLIAILEGVTSTNGINLQLAPNVTV